MRLFFVDESGAESQINDDLSLDYEGPESVEKYVEEVADGAEKLEGVAVDSSS